MEQNALEKTALEKPSNELKKILDSYLVQIPVVGYNSSNYDLNLIKRYLIKYIQSSNSERDYMCKDHNCIKCLSTTKLRFLDITRYLAPGQSYGDYLRALEIEGKKGFFPYEYIDSLDRLIETALPPREAFNSKLKGFIMSQTDYAHCQQIWNQKKMKTLRDWLVYYNSLDVEPFLKALNKQI